MYFGEDISLGMIIHILQHCIFCLGPFDWHFFYYGTVLTKNWDCFDRKWGFFGLRPFSIGAVLTGNHAYNTCSIFLPPILKALFSSLEHNVLRVSYCDWPLSVVHLPSLVVCQHFYLNIFSSETAHWIFIKLRRNDPRVVQILPMKSIEYIE